MDSVVLVYYFFHDVLLKKKLCIFSPEKHEVTQIICSHCREYFLQISDGLSEEGNMVWYLAIALLVTWFLLFMCTAKEPSFMNKVKKNAEDTRQCAMHIYF